MDPGKMDYRRIKNETKEEQEALWAGDLGGKYNTRNLDTQNYFHRGVFWKRLQTEYNLGKILEVGCNRGYNLEHLIYVSNWIYGIDINRMAIAYCHKEMPFMNTIQGSVFDLPFKTCSLMVGMISFGCGFPLVIINE